MLGLLVTRMLVAIKLQLVDPLLVLKLHSLLDLLLHILKNNLAVQLSLPNFVLVVDL